MKLKSKHIILIIFFLALVLRIGYMSFLQGHYFFYDYPSSDVTYYQYWAGDIATHDFIGNKVFWGLPLFPYFLTLIYTISFGFIEIMRLFLIVLGSINCVLLYLLAKKIFQSERIGILAGILMATNFILIYYDWLMMPVTLIITLSLVIASVLIERHRFHLKHWLLLGLLIGLTILGDGKFLFFLAGVSVLVFLQDKITKQTVMGMMALWIGTCSVLGLCTLRNRIVSGDWIMISAQSGLSLYSGNYQGATGVYKSPPFIRPTHEGQDVDQRLVAESIVGRSMSPKEVSNFWKQQAVKYMKDNPRAYARLLLQKARIFFTDTEYAADLDLAFQRNWKRLLDINGTTPLLMLALIGMLLCLRKNPAGWGPVLMIGAQFLIVLVFFVSTRYRATIIPFLILFEAWIFEWLVIQIKRKKILPIILVLMIVGAGVWAFPVEYREETEMAVFQYFKTGMIYEEQQQYDLAEQQYLSALRIQPNHVNSIMNLGNVYFLKGDLIGAEGCYRQVLAIAPLRIDVMGNLGIVLEDTGRFDEALKLYEYMLKIQPGNPDMYYRIGKILCDQGNCVQGEQYLREAVRLDPRLRDLILPIIQERKLK